MTPEMQAALRKPFEGNQISKFPQTAGKKAGLSYVGHAAITDRIISIDPMATWEFFPVDQYGRVMFEPFTNEVWCKLTIGGVTRSDMGVEPCTTVDGSPKKGGTYTLQEASEVQAMAKQSAIANALTRAAMRFGIGLDLWHKNGLLYDEPTPEPEKPKTITPAQAAELRKRLEEVGRSESKFTGWLSTQLKVSCIDDIPEQSFKDVIDFVAVIAKRAEAKAAAKADIANTLGGA